MKDARRRVRRSVLVGLAWALLSVPQVVSAGVLDDVIDRADEQIGPAIRDIASSVAVCADVDRFPEARLTCFVILRYGYYESRHHENLSTYERWLDRLSALSERAAVASGFENTEARRQELTQIKQACENEATELGGFLDELDDQDGLPFRLVAANADLLGALENELPTPVRRELQWVTSERAASTLAEMAGLREAARETQNDIIDLCDWLGDEISDLGPELAWHLTRVPADEKIDLVTGFDGSLQASGQLRVAFDNGTSDYDFVGSFRPPPEQMIPGDELHWTIDGEGSGSGKTPVRIHFCYGSATMHECAVFGRPAEEPYSFPASGSTEAVFYVPFPSSHADQLTVTVNAGTMARLDYRYTAKAR